MTNINRDRLVLALRNASEMIRGHVEIGLEPEDVNEKDQKGLDEYQKACVRAAKAIDSLAVKYDKITSKSLIK